MAGFVHLSYKPQTFPTQSLAISKPVACSATTGEGTSNGVVVNSQRSKGPVIAEIAVDNIRRPLSRTRANDPEKVRALMESIAQIGLQEPIDVLEVDGIYYGFSGCHRFEAHQRLGLPTIRCRIRRGTKETLRHHMR